MGAVENFLSWISHYGVADVAGLLERGVGGALSVLHHPSVPLFLSLLLLLASVLCAAWYIVRRIWPAHRAIMMAAHAVESAADAVAFTPNFPRFDRAMNELAVLRRPWLQFRVGVFVPPQSTRTPVRHHLRAGDYLHLRGLEDGGFNFRFFRSWAGMFVFMGLLLSLLGFTADLHAAWPAMEYTTAPAFKIVPLLSGMIAGLILSTAYQWSLNRLRQDLLRLSSALEARIVFSPIPVSAQTQAQLTGPAGYTAPGQDSTAQTAIMQGLSTDFVKALSRIETHLIETLPGRIGEAMHPVSNALDLLGKRLSEANSEALRQAVGDLSLGLHKGAAQDLDALTGVLEEARAALADVCNVMREASRESSSQLVLAGESLTAQLDRTFREADLAISPLTAQMAEFGDTLNQINTALGQNTHAFLSVIDSAQKAIHAMDETLDRRREAAEEFAQHPAIVQAGAASTAHYPVLDVLAADDLAQAARDVSSSVDAVSDARRALKRLSSRLRQPATALLTEDWERHRENLTGDEALTEVLENFRDGASKQRAGLDLAVEDLETRLERLFRDLEAGASRLENAIQTLRRQAQSGAPPAPHAPPAAGNGEDAA